MGSTSMPSKSQGYLNVRSGNNIKKQELYKGLDK